MLKWKTAEPCRLYNVANLKLIVVATDSKDINIVFVVFINNTIFLVLDGYELALSGIDYCAFAVLGINNDPGAVHSRCQRCGVFL